LQKILQNLSFVGLFYCFSSFEAFHIDKKFIHEQILISSCNENDQKNMISVQLRFLRNVSALEQPASVSNSVYINSTIK